MKCRNCGTEFPDGMKYCPTCGKAFGKAKVGRILGRTVAVFTATLLVVAALVLGIGLGVKGTAKVPEPLDFMQTLANKIRSVTSIPLNVSFSEEQINDFIRSNSDSIKPLNDLKFAFGEGEKDIILSGSMSKEGIQQLTGGNLPPILLVFLPQTSSLRLDATLDIDSDTKEIIISVKSLKVSDVQIEDSLLSSLDADEFLSKALNDALESYVGENLKLESISITRDSDGVRKLRIKGTYSLAVEE